MKIEEEKLKKGAILEKKRRFDQLKSVYKLLNHVPSNGVATGKKTFEPAVFVNVNLTLCLF